MKTELTPEQLEKRRAYHREYKKKRIQEVGTKPRYKKEPHDRKEYAKEYYKKNKQKILDNKKGYCEYCKVQSSNMYEHNLSKKHIATVSANAIEKLNLEPPEPKEPTLEQMKKCFEYEGVESGEDKWKELLALRATEFNSASAKSKTM